MSDQREPYTSPTEPVMVSVVSLAKNDPEFTNNGADGPLYSSVPV